MRCNVSIWNWHHISAARRLMSIAIIFPVGPCLKCERLGLAPLRLPRRPAQAGALKHHFRVPQPNQSMSEEFRHVPSFRFCGPKPRGFIAPKNIPLLVAEPESKVSLVAARWL